MGDGYPNTAEFQISPRLMVCENCGYDVVNSYKKNSN